MRRIPAVAFAAAVLVVILLPVASIGLWEQREIVTTSAFEHLADRVLEQRPVRREITDTVITELDSEVPELGGQASLLRPIVAKVVRTAQVRAALAHSLTHTHAQLRNGHDPLQLDLNPVLPVVRHQLPQFVADEIPADVKLETVTVVHRSDAPVIWVSVEFVQGFALAIALVTSALLILAIITARRRGLICLVLGLITMVMSLVMIALVEPGRTLFEHEAGGSIRREALRAGYYTVIHSFATQMIALAVAGAVLALAGLVLVREDRPMKKTPRIESPAEPATTST